MCSNVAREAELQQISPRRKCSESLLLSFLYEAFNLFIFSFSLDMDRVSLSLLQLCAWHFRALFDGFLLLNKPHKHNTTISKHSLIHIYLLFFCFVGKPQTYVAGWLFPCFHLCRKFPFHFSLLFFVHIQHIVYSQFRFRWAGTRKKEGDSEIER